MKSAGVEFAVSGKENIPEGNGAVIRTAAIGKKEEDIINLNVDIKYTLIFVNIDTKEEVKIEDESKIRCYTGLTLDISGGGVRFNSEYSAQSNDILVMRIAFMSQESQKLQPLFAKVLTVLPVQNRSGIFEHRVEYTAITNAERECIIRYIFAEERKRRKKETGIE